GWRGSIIENVAPRKYFVGNPRFAHARNCAIPICYDEPSLHAARLTAPTVRRNALIGEPYVLGQLALSEEHIDGYAAARIPIAANAEPMGSQNLNEPFADCDRAIFMESAVIAEGSEIEFERFRFHEQITRDVIDNQMREVGLSCHWTKRGEFRR